MIGATLQFESELDLQMVGTYRYHAVRLPLETQAQIEFPTGVKQRFEGSLNGVSFAGAFLPTGTGRYYMMVNGALRKKLGLDLGDRVEVAITIVDPSIVEVPEDVLQALSESEEVLFKWEILTAGMKRGILHQVSSAKAEETRRRRIQSLVERLREAQPFEPFGLRKLL